MRRRLTAACVIGLMTIGGLSPAFAETRILETAKTKATRESSGRLSQAPQGAPQTTGKGGLFWTGVTVAAISAIGLLATEQTCQGTRINDRCLGDPTWPAGQIGGWSAGLGAGVLLMILD